MKVILKENLKNIGKAGEVIQVKKGFARNYLFPKKLAIMANPKSIKHQEHLNHVTSLRKEKALSEKQKLLKEISNIELTFYRSTSEKNKLFAAVTVNDILKELEKKNINLDKKDIFLKAPIKTLGEHVANVKLEANKKEVLKIKILSQKTEKNTTPTEEKNTTPTEKEKSHEKEEKTEK